MGESHGQDYPPPGKAPDGGLSDGAALLGLLGVGNLSLKLRLLVVADLGLCLELLGVGELCLDVELLGVNELGLCHLGELVAVLQAVHGLAQVICLHLGLHGDLVQGLGSLISSYGVCIVKSHNPVVKDLKLAKEKGVLCVDLFILTTSG